MTTDSELGGAPSITSYVLYYAAGPSYTYAVWTGLSSTDTSTTRTVTGLTPDTDYKFKVNAQNIHGWSPSNSSESTVARTSTTVPDKVTGVMTAVSASGLGVDITWDAYVPNGLSVTKV